RLLSPHPRPWAGPTGRMPAPTPGINSIAGRSNPGQAASVRGQSNQVLSEVLRAGHESTAGLSPLSTPDSILICYPKLGKPCHSKPRQHIHYLRAEITRLYSAHELLRIPCNERQPLVTVV